MLLARPLGPALFCSDHEHSRYPLRHLHANNCPPASLLPCPPLPPVTECHARPLHATREAYASCLAPDLPLYLQTSVPNAANDVVAAARRTLNSCLLPALVPLSVLLLPYLHLSCLDGPCVSPGVELSVRLSHSLFAPSVDLAAFSASLGHLAGFSAPQSGLFKSSDPQRPPVAPPSPGSFSVRTSKTGRSNRHGIRVIGQLRHFLPFGEEILA